MKYYLILFSVLFFLGCQFQPYETYESENININVSPPNIEVVSINVTTKTIRLRFTSRLEYVFKSDNQTIKSVNFYANGNLVENKLGAQGSFHLKENYFPNEVNTLKLEVITISGTGSLSDDLGGEIFIIPFLEFTVKQ